MWQFKSFVEDLKSMFSTPLTPSSPKPTLNPRRIGIGLMFILFALIFGLIFGLLTSLGSKSSPDRKISGIASISSESESKEGSQVISFNSLAGQSTNTKKGFIASNGTLIRARLLNSLETFDTVPSFAQVSDYSLGREYHGWTLVGDASSDGAVDRVKMNFNLLKNPRGTRAFEIGGQALSLDGTLGIKAEKVEGQSARATLGAAKYGSSNLSSALGGGTNDLGSFFIRALLSGLSSELGADFNSKYNRSVSLHLKPGEEFFVQLTENF